MSDNEVSNPICTVDPECGEIAVAQYVWPWGETGLCCPRHQTILGQKAKQLKREIQITALRPGAERPVTRDERIQAHATRMALEAELAEAQTRGMELYRNVEQLQAQLKTAIAQKAELEAQLESARRTAAEAQRAAGEIRTKAAKENAELQQLRALLPKETPQKVDGTVGT